MTEAEGTLPSTVEASDRPRFVFCCRRCRTPLFTDAEVVRHSSSKKAQGNKGFRRNGGGGGADDHGDDEEEACTSYFLDPDVTPWVSAESRAVAAAVEGVDAVLPDTIYCKNTACGAKIGTQSWTGAQCSCGAWITPAFKVLMKTVDKLPADLVPL